MSKYETHVWENPEIPFIFNKMHLGEHQRVSGANWHENLELLYIMEGTGTVWVDGMQLPVKKGDQLIMNSNCLHDVSTNDDIRYYYLVVDRSFCLANHFDTNKLLFRTKVFQDPVIVNLLQQLMAEYKKQEEHLFRTQAIRAIVLFILVHLCRQYSHPSKNQEESHLLSCIKQAIGYIRSNSDSPDLTLENITEFVGLSKYYFAHKFKQITGYTCVQYINMIRCEKAKAMLRDKQMDIGEIGQLCGFNSQSYFTRIFHSYVGVSPSMYRQKQLSQNKK